MWPFYMMNQTITVESVLITDESALIWEVLGRIIYPQIGYLPISVLIKSQTDKLLAHLWCEPWSWTWAEKQLSDSCWSGPCIIRMAPAAIPISMLGLVYCFEWVENGISVCIYWYRAPDIRRSTCSGPPPGSQAMNIHIWQTSYGVDGNMYFPWLLFIEMLCKRQPGLRLSDICKP